MISGVFGRSQGLVPLLPLVWRFKGTPANTHIGGFARACHRISNRSEHASTCWRRVYRDWWIREMLISSRFISRTDSSLSTEIGAVEQDNSLKILLGPWTHYGGTRVMTVHPGCVVQRTANPQSDMEYQDINSHESSTYT